jgi:acyl-CoA synthetase (AMP-forming)/AMP-acid ligase II
MVLAALQGHPGVLGACVEAHRGSDDSDQVVVHVAVRDPQLTAERITEELRAHLRFAPEVLLASEAAVNARIDQPGKRKPTLFLDLRGQGEEQP